MGRVTEFLVRKHALVATIILPTSVALGFLYTQHTGKHALTSRHYTDPAVTYTYQFKTGGIANK